jgi:Holliday junction resolvasome RuvABC DNA-binding subunit
MVQATANDAAEVAAIEIAHLTGSVRTSRPDALHQEVEFVGYDVGHNASFLNRAGAAV